MNKDFYLGIASTLIATLIIYIVSKTIKRIKERKNQYDFVWIPNNPICNSGINVRSISDYPKDFKAEMVNGQIQGFDGRTTFQGFESFRFHLIKFMLTEKWKYKIYTDEYGISCNLIDSKTQEEFAQICQIISMEILSFFKDWIVSIHAIKKYKKEKGVEITIMLKGINNLVNIDVPLIKSKI